MTCYMYMVAPIPLTEAKQTSTNAPISAPAWVEGTTYAKDAQVTHPGRDGLPHAWLSFVNDNTQTPGEPPASGDALAWGDMGASNHVAHFDNYNSTQSLALDELQFVIKPGSVFTDFALFNIDGNTVRAEVIALNGDVIFDETKSMLQRKTASWSEYYFAGFDGRLTQAIFTGIPFSTTASVRVTITGIGSVGVGRVVCGRRVNLGKLELGVSPFINDYSRKEWDADFGDYEWTVRDFSRGFSGTLLVDNGQINSVWTSIISVRAVPTLFVGSEDERFSELLVTLGVLQEARPSITYPEQTLLTFQVEGLT